ncbi:hypothetical protein DICPUDRAFT_80754 [Dictyostelium purpureum]|uniref:EGF-like domain-containing protein n=1 Tax=Dictyostelium purpureum TaxID=5786 RepID=F0ZRF5_DICPU|nr:uncharacterized protein DICPUDRAFT_80754 [Dictyostelium purpureum]EGC33472.1 hypothetical protein DICPUDRAFT_80754 [Dictyostelium purpureum]|eukprot:XP_003289995.1 hypothetical protein DICPUDRAFT_80754 [Dictyostelium purpureum]
MIRLENFFKLIFIFLLFIYCNNGYIVKTLPSNILQAYVTQYRNCVFYLDVICIAENISEDCNDLKATYVNSGISVTESIIFSNKTSSVIKRFTLISPLGQNSVSFGSQVSLEISCIDIDLNKISLKSLSKDYFLYSIPDGDASYSIISLYQLVGVEPKTSLESIYFQAMGTGKCLFSRSTQVTTIPIFLYSCPKVVPISFDFSSIKVNLTVGTNTKVFSLDPMFKDSLELYDIKTYPELKYLDNMNLFGNEESALVSFKMNTVLEKGYFMMTKNGVLEETKTIFPIFGDESSTTYITPLSNYGPVTTEIYYPSNSKVIKSTTQIKSNINRFNKISIPSVQSYSLYSDGLPILIYGFTDNKRYDFDTISLSVSNVYPRLTRFPFGYIYGDKNGYKYEVDTVVKPYYSSPLFLYMTSGKYSNTSSFHFPVFNTTYISSKAKLIGFEKFQLISDIYLVRVQIDSPNLFNYIMFDNLYSLGYESLVSGNLSIGTYEFIYKHSDQMVYFYDQTFSVFALNRDQIVTINNQEPVYFNGPPRVIFDMTLIKDVSFLYNDLDITYHRHYNVFYFNYSDSVPRETIFRMVPKDLNMIQDSLSMIYSPKSFVSTWNNTLNLFQIEFFIEANTEIGTRHFFLVSNDLFIHSKFFNTQLRVKSSSMDYQGPIFIDIKKITNKLVTKDNIGTIGWTFKIEDSINGFDNGFVVIKGEMDYSNYNITFSSTDVKAGGDKYSGEYDITIDVSYPCISQNYIINDVVLFDTLNRKSLFSIFPESLKDSVLNPFLNFLQDTNINKVQIQCESPNAVSSDTTPPQLTQFYNSIELTSNGIIDSSRINSVSFTFTAIDNESGIKDKQYPIVYASDSNNRFVKCVSTFVTYQGTNATYSCSTMFPIGFGYPGIITLSVYGFINNNGLFSGFSANGLKNNNFKYYISTKFVELIPYLTGSSKITEKGGELWVYGSNLSLGTWYIKYDTDRVFMIADIGKVYSTAVQFKNIKATTKPFSVYSSNVKYSTQVLMVTPEIYDWNLLNCNGNGAPGKSSGKCICNNKWTTLDPLSQCTVNNHYITSSTQVSSTEGGEVILSGWFSNVNVNPKLYINNNEANILSITTESIKTTIGPGTFGAIPVSYYQNGVVWSGNLFLYKQDEKQCPLNCEINGVCDKKTGICSCNKGYTGLDCASPEQNNNNNTTTETEVGNNGTTIIKNQDIGYLISIDSIVELDFKNEAVLSFNLTNNWVFVNKTNSVSFFNQTIHNSRGTTTLTLIIEEVNEKDKDFSFAGNDFTVTKGGLKLSLSISNWQYLSNLNTLQIQMSSDIQINQNSECNEDNKDAMVESSSNNHYLTNNINYLKITKNNRVLYSRFQDKMLSDNRPTTITSQLLSSNNSFVQIGLNLPHCDECLIDPDFSLLINSNYKFECKDPSKKWIIAVAVVAGVYILKN